MDAKLLAELKDIHYPSPLSWLTLAPGWWIALGILSAFILYVAWRRQKHRAANRAKKYALAYLAQLERAAKTQKSDALLAGEVDALLKRTALFFFPRETLASLNGQAWLDFLSQHDKYKRISAYRYELTELPYQDVSCSVKSTDMRGLFAAAKAWVKQRSEPCSL